MLLMHTNWDIHILFATPLYDRNSFWSCMRQVCLPSLPKLSVCFFSERAMHTLEGEPPLHASMAHINLHKFTACFKRLEPIPNGIQITSIHIPTPSPSRFDNLFGPSQSFKHSFLCWHTCCPWSWNILWQLHWMPARGNRSCRSQRESSNSDWKDSTESLKESTLHAGTLGFAVCTALGVDEVIQRVLRLCLSLFSKKLCSWEMLGAPWTLLPPQVKQTPSQLDLGQWPMTSFNVFSLKKTTADGPLGSGVEI